MAIGIVMGFNIMMIGYRWYSGAYQV